MHYIRIALAVLIFCQAPVLFALINDGPVPKWMVGLSIVGLLIAAVVYFFPRRQDVDA
jgi:VIT1/CCC1 family predicted Fe2+/Mn2+ transporter